MKKLVSSWLLFSSALALVLSVVAFSRAADTPPANASGTQGANSSAPTRPALRGARALGPFSIFDTNHDGVLSADEINNAPAVLRSLDKNGDGKLTADELRPHGPPPPRKNDGSGPPSGGRPEGPEGDLPPPPPPET